MWWLESLLSQATVERLGWMLVHFLWQAAVVATLLAVFMRLLQESSANVRYLTACSAMALIVALPVVTMQFIDIAGPTAEAGPLPVAASVAAPPAQIQTVETLTPLAQAEDSSWNATAAPAVPWKERIASALEPALPYAVLGWLAGVFGLSTWHLGGWMQLQRFKRRMVHDAGDVLQQRLTQIAGRLGVHRAVTLLESALVEVPTVVGWLRPAILLPASALTGLNGEQLEAILAHELAHIRRCDYLVNILQTIVEILGFYHPAVWWVSRRIRIERENCCDDAAVRLCGDSVRYARALTCLEEIRHSRTDLAMAATGGSLLDRIARLLGRPATDDRRFTWLPGLITLLLVVAIVIPAALALSASASDRRQSASATAADPALAAQDTPHKSEPNNSPYLLDFTIAEISSEATLDQDTAAKVAGLLERKPAEGSRRAAGPAAAPTIDEVRQPLGDVLAKFTPKPGKGKHFVDWLVSREYARIITNPRVAVTAGDRASISVGNESDPNAAQPQGEVAFLKLNVTANPVRDPNATLLDLDFTMEYSSFADANRATTLSQVSSKLVVLNNQYTLITDPGILRVGEDGRKYQSLLLVHSAIIKDSPQASEPNTPKMNVTAAAREPNAVDPNTVQVQVEMRIITTTDSKELDREAVLRIEKILGKRVRPEGSTGEFGPDFHLTVGDVFRDQIVGQPLSGDKLAVLLPMLGDEGMKVLACPRVVVRNGEPCQIKVVDDEYFYPANNTNASDPTKLEKVEAGTRVDLTPVIGDNNAITLDLTVEMTSFLRPPTSADVPIVTRRTAKVMVTTLNDQCVTIAGMKADDQSMYIMATPTIFEPPADSSAVSNSDPLMGTPGMGGFKTPADAAAVLAVSATSDSQALTTPGKTELRDVLADVARRYGAEIDVDETVKPQAVAANIAADSVEAAITQALKGTPYTFSKVGAPRNKPRESLRITNVFTGDELVVVLQDLATLAGVTLVVDDTVSGSVYADMKDVSLDTALEMVLAGTPYVVKKMPDYYLVTTYPRLSASKGNRIFEEKPGPSSPAKNAYRVYLPLSNVFVGDDRRQALMDVAAASGISIAIDANVRGKVWAQFNAVPLETALRILTAGTAYVVEKKPDHYEVVAAGTAAGSPRTENPGTSAAAAGDKAQVLVDCLVVDVAARKALDRRTAAEAAGLLAETALKPTAKDLQRPLGQVLRQYTTNNELSGPPLDAFVDLLISRGYARVLSRPKILMLDGTSGQIVIGNDPDSRDNANSSKLTLAVTPTFHPEQDTISLDLHYEVQRQSDGKSRTGFNGAISEAMDLELLAKNGQSTAVPRTPSGTWPGDQRGERLLLMVIKATVPRQPPTSNATGAVSTPGTTETRQVQMKYEEPQQATSLLSPTLQPYTRPAVAKDIDPNEDGRQVALECRFVVVDDAWMEAFTRGLPFGGLTSPEDVNAWHEIGAALSTDKASVLNQTQADLVVRAVQGHSGSKSLAAPKVTVSDREPAEMSLSDQLSYIRGYTEPGNPALAPVPELGSESVGIAYRIQPTLVEDHNAIRIALTSDIRSLLEIRKVPYRDSYEYEVPMFEDVHLSAEVFLPDGWTALIGGKTVPNVPGAQPAGNAPSRHLLVLLKATKVSGRDPTPPSTTPPLPGGPGMGDSGPTGVVSSRGT